MNHKPLLHLQMFRSLDYIPTGWAVVSGLALGFLIAGALLIGLPLLLGAVLFIGGLCVAVGLAFSGRPVAELLPPIEPEGNETPGPLPEAPPRAPALVELVEIPGGVFRMGSPEEEEGRYDNEGPVHEVKASPFPCMRFQVTRRIYMEIMGEDPSFHKGDSDERPVERVTWFEAIKFCNKLSEKEGLTPCYHFHDEQDVSWSHEANGYRLPTEAEWEYACRAGTDTGYYTGDSEEDLDRAGWYDKNSEGQTHPVGKKEPNNFGLYDMHGNVAEWCWDWYGPYSGDPRTDPIGPPKGDSRVLRGGAFDFRARYLRSAYRNWVEPEDRSRFIGFRCVRGPRRRP